MLDIQAGSTMKYFLPYYLLKCIQDIVYNYWQRADNTNDIGLQGISENCLPTRPLSLEGGFWCFYWVWGLVDQFKSNPILVLSRDRGRYEALIRHYMSNLDPTTTNWRIHSINYHKGRCGCGRIGDRMIILMAAVPFPTYVKYLRMKKSKTIPHATLL